ncbi:hypothetical protein [Falsiroseomonas sp. CW058]|uniref:hypothetical protein n=1 Tax=Falsiroseomonas sp. CW058 TaxID=3388664 RepID=UPI003D316339
MRALLTLPILLLGLGPVPGAAAQDRPVAANQAQGGGGGGARIPRLRKTTTEPFQLGAPATAPRVRSDLAPVPNRSIEAPRDRFSSYHNPTLEPMLLPPERRPGVTFGREHLRETGPDRPFDMVVPGARLRIPIQ